MVKRGCEYFWQSPKDGAFHLVKLNSITKDGNYNMRVLERINDGWVTKCFTQKTNVVITIIKEDVDKKLYTDFGLMLVDYMYETVLCKSYFEFERTLYFYGDFIELIYDYPDRYLKYIDKLLDNKIFKGILDGKYKIPS